MRLIYNNFFFIKYRLRLNTIRKFLTGSFCLMSNFKRGFHLCYTVISGILCYIYYIIIIIKKLCILLTLCTYLYKNSAR